MTGKEKKNMPKWAMYALAYKMIDDSLEYKCPLQAIAIEESILTDRLSSTLNIGRANAKPKSSLGKVLREWKPENCSNRNKNAALFDSEMDALFPLLLEWWVARCDLHHGMVKSSHGEPPEKLAAEFLAYAEKVAKTGLKLTRQVDKWTKRRVRAAEKAATKGQATKARRASR